MMTQYFKDLVACLKEAFKRESEPVLTIFVITTMAASMAAFPAASGMMV